MREKNRSEMNEMMRNDVAFNWNVRF